MASEDDSLRKIPMFTAVHPDNKAYFREIATPKKFIKEMRSNIAVACAQCTKYAEEGKELLRCGKCKIAWYCSKDCQKKQWPIHKQVCKEASSSIPKLLNSFVVNPLLNHFMQLAFIISFNLNEKLILDEPFIVRCDIAVEPADMMYVMRLVMGQLPPAERAQGTEGMLQIKSFLPLRASETIDRARMEIWKNTKTGNVERGFTKNAVGLVDFYMKGTEQTITYGVVIQDDAIRRVNEGVGFAMESALLPGKSEVPLTRQSCLDFINMHIRSDKRNQLRLRTHMTKQDVDKYRNSDDAEAST
ncbi:hypothetical protein BDZ97DRAFT_118334 [Flammula alnicola]|nr:hypothetical protein BDZ97DRAFT_118334 [Flammula alnicola]